MFLGIDLGTSSVKAVVMDAALKPVAEASAALQVSHPQAGWSEQNPQDWWQATCQTVKQATKDHADQIAAIGLSGQMHGAVLLDRDLAPITPAILWNDGRAAPYCAHLSETQPDLAKLAGVRPMPGLTAPKLLWLRDHAPRIYDRIAHILLPKDYIGLHLHGALVTDPSDAAGTWWLDQARATWSDQLCAATATHADWLAPLKNSSEVAGKLTQHAAEVLGLRPGLPIATGAGDTIAGAVALGAIRDGDGFVSLGTSGQIFLVADTYGAAPDQGLHSFAHYRPGLWYHMAAMLNGARPMAWCAEMIGAPIETLLAEAEQARTDALPLALPYLTGERTPHGDAQIRGAIYGLANNTSRGDIMRAMIDAIAYSFADAKDAIETQRPLPETLRVVGGGARADLLLQTLSDAMQITLIRSDDAAIGPALGAARLAALSEGAITHNDLVSEPRITATFVPQQTPRHAQRLRDFRALYQAVKPLRRTV